MDSHDRVTEALVEALRQALTRAGEHRLYKSGKLDGLFPGRTGANGDAAGQALRDGLLEVTRTETKGKTTIDWVQVTPRGVEYLHEQESPARALDALRGALRANHTGVPIWLADMRSALQTLETRLEADARRWQERLDALERRVGDTLRRLESAAPLLPPELAEAHPWAVDALNYLDRRRTGGAADACPLPELFGAVSRHHPELSLGVFHEGLRRLHERRGLQLRPAEDPASLTRPEYALLEGDRVLYLAER